MVSRAIPLSAFRDGDGFFARIRALIRETVVPYQYEILNDRIPGVEKSHALENLRLAGQVLQGQAVEDPFYGMVFQDSDVYKWLEAAAYTLATVPDPVLKAQIDSVVATMEQAQHPDGYLNSYFTLKEPTRRWTDLEEAHELYCAGHLFEAACAYHEAAGDTRLLALACRYADHIYDHFMQDCPRGFSGHPEVELALLRLYRVTGEHRYLELAGHFLDVRGLAPHFFLEERARRDWSPWRQTHSSGLDSDYSQSSLPVRQQQDAVGHAVRAVYLYTAMADLARETGDREMEDACLRLWNSITRKRMYVTGSIGSTVIGEAFTVDYDLPNDTAYAETCASVGLIFFARKLLELSPRGEYGDVMERALYNTVLAGMSLDGKQFFYVNPLDVTPGITGAAVTQRHVELRRPGWYVCACCPPNAARLLSSLGSYAYSVGKGTLFVHLYLNGSVDSGLGFRLHCQTEYPHSGLIHFRIEGNGEAAIALRIPGWSRHTSLLYNGQQVSDALSEDGYAYLRRHFADGDTITLSLDMTPRKLYADLRVSAAIGRAAV